LTFSYTNENYTVVSSDKLVKYFFV
jgi:hypothetical protein